MKKLLLLTLAVIMTLSLAACGGSTTSSEATVDTTASDVTTASSVTTTTATAATTSSEATTATANTDVTLKDDLTEYVNNNVLTVFTPENDNIVKTYIDALDSPDEKIYLTTLKETLPTMNSALLEKLKAYTPKTAEVQELHNLFIKAVEIRSEGYALMAEAQAAKASDGVSLETDTAVTTALLKLGEASAKLKEFEAKRASMMTDLGLEATNE